MVSFVGWVREGLPVLSNFAGPIQQLRAAILGPGWGKVSADLCARQGFRGGPWLDVDGSLQLLNSDHVREREIRLCSGVSLLVVFGMVFCFIRSRVSVCLALSVGVMMVMVISFGSALSPPLVEIREHPEFHDLVELDKSYWRRCLVWHGWLPLLSGVNGFSPWAGKPSGRCL